MVIIDSFSRCVVGFNAQPGPIDGVSVCRMFNRIISGQTLPNRISTDHDPLFRFHRWLANLRVLGVEEIKSIPCTPVSHPYVERVIGTVRREYLNKLFFWNSGVLERKLDAFKNYYNESRVHSSLEGHVPANRAGLLRLRPLLARLDHDAWKSHCSWLFSTPVAA